MSKYCLGSQLIEACKKGNFEECERCLGEGANPSYPDERKWDPLLWASYNGYAKVLFKISFIDLPIINTKRSNNSLYQSCSWFKSR